jgi:hypothetical protein
MGPHPQKVGPKIPVAAAKQCCYTREKGRWAIDLSTGSFISLVLLGRGWRGRVERNDRMKEGGALAPTLSKYHFD